MSQSEEGKKLVINFKLLRMNVDKNLNQISKETGIAYSFLHGIENMNKSPSLETIDKIAKYFGVEIYELFL